MFNNFLSALDEYLEVQAEYARDEDKYRSTYSGWHDSISQRRRKAAANVKSALDAYIESKLKPASDSCPANIPCSSDPLAVFR